MLKPGHFTQNAANERNRDFTPSDYCGFSLSQHQIRKAAPRYWITSISQYVKGSLARSALPPLPYAFPVNVPITARSNINSPKSKRPSGHCLRHESKLMPAMFAEIKLSHYSVYGYALPVSILLTVTGDFTQNPQGEGRECKRDLSATMAPKLSQRLYAH